MSVIVKGMEMPNACCHCPCSDTAGCAVTGRSMTTEEMAGQLGDIDDCPLRPLPEKHGRLIDGEELAAGCGNPYWCRWLSEIEAMPTIVEAEGDDG